MKRRARAVPFTCLGLACLGLAGMSFWACRPAALTGPADRAPLGAAAGRPTFLGPCHLPGVQREAVCLRFRVFENRAARSGRKIDLQAAVLPARSSEPRRDPVFFLDGGPGNAATEAAGDLATLLEDVLEERDLVLVDQRGTGGSNPLECDFGKAGGPGGPASLQGGAAELFQLEAVRECRRKLEQRTDLTQYTTPVAMEDLEEVRAALGYERINLIGASYGTGAAQVYLRAHPERVRSLVLLAPAPLEIRYPLYVARDVQRALDLLFDDCAAEPACHAAFPELRQDFARLVERLEKGPVRVELSDPATGRPATAFLSLDLLRLTLPTRLYSTEAGARVPLAIHRAANGEPADLTRASLAIWRRTWGGGNQGMTLSVSCAEDSSRLAPDEVAEAVRGTFLGDLRVRLHRERCSVWPKATLPPGFAAPVRSEVPALLLAGGLDPILPPAWAQEVARGFPNGKLVVVPKGAHWVIDGCTRDLIRDFLLAGSAAGLDPACVEQSRRPPFLVP